jgi:hypothetical protein
MNWIDEKLLEELRCKAYGETVDKEIEIDGIPICKNMQIEPLNGEIFEKYKSTNIEVSNIGRIKLEDEILKQYKIYDGYLYVCLPYSVQNYPPYIPDLVYRLVAETWVIKNDEKLNIVHHISNNGYDNTRENLMWVNYWQHILLHPKLNIDFKKVNVNEIETMIYYYNKINIVQCEYLKIDNIVKKYKELTNNTYNDDIGKIIEELKGKYYGR